MQQLAGMDAVFLAMETDEVHAHTGGLMILDPSEAPNFGFDRLLAVMRERIPLVPRFCSTLREVPLGIDRPYWTETPDFDVADHLHRIGVPRPGRMREVAEICGYLFSQKLDRRRPLWEMWFIEGLENGRAAIFAKTHHCLMDGVSGAALGEIMCDLQPDPPPRSRRRAKRRRSEPRPDDSALFLKGVSSLFEAPIRLGLKSGQLLRYGARSISQFWSSDLSSLFPDVPPTSFNADIGPRRAFSCASVPLAEVKEVKDALGVKINDVVLELCGAALRRYLLSRDELPERPLVFSVPMSTRSIGDDGLGNQVLALTIPCASHLADPVERLRQIHLDSRKAKEAGEAMRGAGLESLADIFPPILINLSIRSADLMPSFANAVVSNVPGPPIPLYSAGARIEALYPMSILPPGQGVNVTAMSFIDRVDFGFTVDPDLVSDPWVIAKGIEIAWKDLKRAARRRTKARRAGKSRGTRRAGSVPRRVGRQRPAGIKGGARPESPLAAVGN